jgi:hypothetical protein
LYVLPVGLMDLVGKGLYRDVFTLGTNVN